MNIKGLSTALVLGLTVAVGCTDGNNGIKENVNTREPDARYVGQAVGNFSAAEWYPGGELGTTDNVTAGCYEDETPAVTAQGLSMAFNLGEAAFERSVKADFVKKSEDNLYSYPVKMIVEYRT